MPTTNEWRALYKAFMCEANKFHSYSWREFAKRRINDYCNEYKAVSDPKQQEVLYKEAQKRLESLRRQVLIDNLYKHDKLVVENYPDNKQ